MAANTSAVSLESLFLQLLGRLDSAGRCTSSTTTSSCRRRSLRSEIRSLELWRAVIGECLATFFYVFLVCGAHVSWPGYAEPSVLAIALTSGAAAATLVQCYGHISGAHMNPAVTLATFATRKVSPIRTILYVSAQCGGAIAGAALLYGVSVPGHQSSLGSNRPHEALGAWQAFGVEFVLSFLLSSTVFATRDPHRSHLSAGSDAVVIGFAYLACTLAGLPATGASMNPARSLGPAFVMNKWVDHWVYWFGPISGGLLAGLIYEYIFETKKQARALRKTLEDADKESNTDDDYEDPDAKIAKYATVAQSPPNGAAPSSAHQAAPLQLVQHQQQGRPHQHQQYEAAGFGRPVGGNTYSPTPSSAFQVPTEAAYAGSLRSANYASSVYGGTRLGTALRTLPARLEYGQGPGSPKF